MKKIILLLALPLVTLMAVEFTMTPSGLFAKTTTQPSTPTPDTVPEAKSSYLEPVNLPECDASNPEVQFIKSNADWSHINDANKRIFCVIPGDYSGSGQIIVTADGTATKRRYIILNNGNDTHPGKLPYSQQANVQLKFNGANYWILDRMSTYNITSTKTFSIDLVGQSNYNIFNRHYLAHFYNGFRLGHLSNNNTIQNSRIANQTLIGRKSDRTCISLTEDYYRQILPGAGVQTLKNNKILSNEIVNCNDGIQAVKDRVDGINIECNFEGTIIDSNHIYIDSSLYTDGNGNPNPTGHYAYAENAIDLKDGSDNPANPMIITNNYMWGYKESDRTNSSLNDHGNAIVIHFGAKNLVFENNVVFNSNRGIYAGDSRQWPHALSDSSISKNIFYNNHNQRTGSGYDLLLYETSNTRIEKNIIVGSKIGKWLQTMSSSGNTFSGNAIINSNVTSLEGSNTFSRNFFYKTEDNTNGSDNEMFQNISDAAHDNVIFWTDNLTNKPKQITLKGVLPTSNSPHGTWQH